MNERGSTTRRQRCLKRFNLPLGASLLTVLQRSTNPEARAQTRDVRCRLRCVMCGIAWARASANLVPNGNRPSDDLIADCAHAGAAPRTLPNAVAPRRDLAGCGGATYPGLAAAPQRLARRPSLNGDVVTHCMGCPCDRPADSERPPKLRRRPAPHSSPRVRPNAGHDFARSRRQWTFSCWRSAPTSNPISDRTHRVCGFPRGRLHLDPWRVYAWACPGG